MDKALRFYGKIKNTRIGYVFAYTLCFAVISLMTFRYFIAFRKTTIIIGDGISQNYNTLLYYSKLLRQVIQTFVKEHTLRFPMWDVSAGLGEDILQTMHYYGVGEPIMLLAALLPPSRTDYLYCFIYIARLYMGGLAFSWFSLWHGNRKFATMLGSFVYIFSGYSLTLAMKHLMFGVPIAFFPLILLGADKVIKEKKAAMFILSTAFAALSNIYFFYAQMVFAVIYCLYRLVRMKDGFGRNDYIRTILRLLLSGICALLAAAVVLLPELALLLAESRVGRGYPYTLTYGLKYYFEYIAGFTNLQQAEGLMTAGYSVIALLALIILFIRRKRNFYLKLAALFFLIFSFVPYFAYMMNGFSYVTNRWVWAMAMYLGYLTARIYPEVFELEHEKKMQVAAAALVISIFSLALPQLRSMHTFASIMVLTGAAVLMVAFDFRGKDGLYARVGVSAVFMAGLYLMTYRLWSPDFADEGKYNIGKYVDINTADDILENRNSDATIDLIGDKEFFRVGEIGVTTGGGNSGLHRSVNLCRRYFSMMLPNISEFIRELGFNTQMDFKLEGTDRRSIMDALLGVRYYNVKEGEEALLPFNYDTRVSEADTYDGHSAAWKNEHYLPLGYTYDTAIDSEKFYALDLAGRQEAMLYGAVLSKDEIEDTGLEEFKVNDALSRRSVLKTITPVKGENVRITENGIDVYDREAVLRFEINGLPESETYVVLNGADYEYRSLKDALSDAEWKSLSAYERAGIEADEFLKRPDDSAKLYFGLSEGEYTNETEYFTPMHDCYTGHDSFIVNLGYSEDGLSEIYCKLPKPGFYSFDSLDVVCQSVEDIDLRLDALRAEHLEDENIELNTITGRLKLSRDKLLVLSIPYSTGWRAFVDGREVGTHKANIMFLSFPVSRGEHEIVLRYETPYLRVGAALTAAGFVMLMMMVVIERKPRRNKSCVTY